MLKGAVLILVLLAVVAAFPAVAANSVGVHASWNVGGGPPPPGGPGGGSESAHFSCVPVGAGSFLSASISCVAVGDPLYYIFNWTVNGQFVSDGPVLNYSYASISIGTITLVVGLTTYFRGLSGLTTADAYTQTVTLDLTQNFIVYLVVFIVVAIVAMGVLVYRRHRG